MEEKCVSGCLTVRPRFITHMWVIVIRAELVQVQQWLVHALLKLQGTFKGLDTTAPLIPVWLLQYKTGQENNETLVNDVGGQRPDLHTKLSEDFNVGFQFTVKRVVFVCQWKISSTAHSHPLYRFVLMLPSQRGLYDSPEWEISLPVLKLKHTIIKENNSSRWNMSTYPDILQEDPPPPLVLQFH